MMSEAAVRDESKQQNPCPVCGETVFRWGHINAPSSGGTKFIYDEQPSGLFARLEAATVKARECVCCGNVLLFTRN